MPLILTALKRILENNGEDHATLSRAEAQALLNEILDSDTNELQIAALLGALAARGETAEELAGFVQALRDRATPIPLTPLEQATCIDTCGTGGDLSGTFNISTAAALVAAAAGATVAKHGNRAVTSRSGSADVLEALGIPVNLTPAQAAEALRTHRFAFLAAPAYHPALARVMPIRRALGVRTAFNILGPMSNPARAQAQIVGVYAPHLVPTVARTLAQLGTRHAFVVHGSGLDEIALHAETRIAEVRPNEVNFSIITPTDFGLSSAPLDTLAGGDAHANAQILRNIFSGQPGPPRDVVLLNAAAVLVLGGLATDFPSATALAAHTINSGSVTRLIAALQQSSSS
jgi:anthranilate phosphoribosyltransferase